MKNLNAIRSLSVLLGLAAVAVLSFPSKVAAQANWNAKVGAESPDMGRQALAFLPNEIWIHAGDTITWTWQSDEIHTLTFLTPGQITPSDFTVGCPGFASSGSAFDGSTCLSTPPMVKGQTFTVSFPTAGNYKFDCLVHNTMTGAIHVLNASETLPHNQDFYDDQAADEQRHLLRDTDDAKSMDDGMDGMAASHASGSMSMRVLSRRNRPSVGIKETAAGDLPGGNQAGWKQVKAGVGEISSTPGGYQQLAILRFLNGTVTIHAGDTVEWTNYDPDEPHTITLGPDPANPFPPSANVTVDSDGAFHAVIVSPSQNVHSGTILQALEDEGGLPSNPLAANPTRFRATFTQPGTYNYHCFFHDTLGMVGKVIVLP